MAETDDFYSQRSVIKHIRPYWYRVLIVGESNYYDGNDLPGNKFDVAGMGKLFRSQTNAVTSLYDATKSQVLNAIAETFYGCSPNTVCVFMFSGHGYVDYDYNISGALSCVDDTSYNHAYITPALLKLYMDYYGSNNNIILLGSCGSGGFIDPNGQERSFDPDRFCSSFINAFKTPDANAGEFRDKSYTVIAAAEAHETGISWTWTLSGALINGGSEIFIALGKAGGYDYCDMNTGSNNGWTKMWGDSNGDKEVTVKEAYQYARWRVPNSKVQFWSERSGLVLFQ